MSTSFATKLSLSLLLLMSGAGAVWGSFQSHLPFSLKIVDARTAVVIPHPGLSMPPGVQAGDRVDLAALDADTRAAVLICEQQGTLPAERTYDFVFRHGETLAHVPVTTVPGGTGGSALAAQWIFLANVAIFFILGLLVLWRGRVWAALLLAIWMVVTLLGFAFNYGFGWLGMADVWVQQVAILFYLGGRVVLYLMIETILGEALSRRARLLCRTGFALTLVLGTSVFAGGHLLFAFSGWAGLMRPELGMLFSAGYLWPAMILVYGYGRAAEAQKPQLRWLLLSLFSFLVGIFLSNSPIFDYVISLFLQSTSLTLGIGLIAYTTLRHRLVDVRVILDHTLVYGATTALVVGVVSALNSLALRATLGEHAGLLLQIVIPLALGIVLSKVRTLLDRVVERVFFRRKYLAEKALETFGRRAGRMQDASKLLDAAVREIRHSLGAPSVALYARETGRYHRVGQGGEAVFPEELDLDDTALVALRTEHASVELPALGSALGDDGCVFPMMVLGDLQGAVVCRNRPGEHYALGERQLLTRVAGDVGAAWRMLRARDDAALVGELAAGTTPVRALRARARASAASA